jgi:hypothetical protein
VPSRRRRTVGPVVTDPPPSGHVAVVLITLFKRAGLPMIDVG